MLHRHRTSSRRKTAATAAAAAAANSSAYDLEQQTRPTTHLAAYLLELVCVPGNKGDRLRLQRPASLPAAAAAAAAL